VRYLPSPATLNGGSSRTLARLCLAVVLIVTAAYAVSAAIVRPTMFSDSGFGFLGWDARRNLPFNHTVVPDSDDISKDAIEFMATWSPGQHILPGLLEECGLSLGLSIVIVTVTFSILGLAGWFALYRAFGFPLRTCAIAVTIVACSHHFALPFGIYTGGEVLLFGTAPWFLLLVWKLRELRWRDVPPLLAGTLAIFLAKLSGIIVAAAAIAAAVPSGVGPWLSRQVARKALVAGTIIAVMSLIFYDLWYSRGWTAVSSLMDVQWSLLASHSVFAVGSIVIASLSLGELAAYVFLHPARPILDSSLPIYYALLPIAIGTLLVVGRHLRKDHADYLRFTLVFAVGVGVVLVWTWASGSSVSVEGRHFRIVSLVLLVGIVHSFIDLPLKSLRVLFAAVVGVAALYGVASAAAHIEANLGRPLGIRGFRHWIANAAVVDFIRTIDVPASDRSATLILVTSPEIGLEVRNVRVMSNHAAMQDAATLRAETYRGRVPRLYVIIQERLIAEGKANIVLNSFVDYPMERWRQIPLGDFVCFFNDG
jgi:hypothetical protein